MDIFLEYLHSLPDGLVYLFLGISAFVENLFPPIPGDTIIAFGAFLVGIGRLDFFLVYLSTTFGGLLGFMSLFWVGGYLGRCFFLKRDYRFFKAEQIVRAEDWFRRYGYFVIALNRFLPGIRSGISVAGGISGLKPIRVCILALASCGVWNLIWISMGYLLGNNWEIVETRLSVILARYNLAILLLFVIFIIFLVVRRRFTRKIAGL